MCPRELRTALLAASAVLCFALLPTVSGASGAVRKVVLEAHVDNPMELAVLPDGRVLFVERFGKVRIWKPDTASTVLSATIPSHGHLNAFNAKEPDRGSWEAGLLGLALDPDFARNGWIYIYRSPAGDFSENRVSRYTLRGDTLDTGSETLVLQVPVQREVCCHEAGSLAFDGKGNLFVSTGDNTNPFECDGYNPMDYRDGRHPFDAARTSGNANDLRGKILRIRPRPNGGYDIPEGNLFPVGTPRTRPEIFVMGCRNPFRIAVDRETGTLVWGDVGPDAREPREGRGPAGFDEFNRTRTAGNFGWPFVIADNRPYNTHRFDTRESGAAFDPEHPVNLSPRNTGPKELPPARPSWIHYPYSASTRFPAVGSGGRTACAGPFYRYDPQLKSPRKLPPEYDQCQFLYEWERNWILVVKTDESGKPVRMERFASEIPLKRPSEMEVGPDGALYLIEFGTGWENNKDSQLVRIEAAPAD